MTDMAGVAVEEEASTEYGVLLYYKYTPPIDDLNSLFDFYHSTCSSLSLLGRVRISPHGVNVTVGGKLSALQQHISAVKDNPLFEGTDFKLASCTQPLNDKVAEECGFTSLSIRIVKELVTLSSNPLLKLPTISDAGRHLSAAEFHSVLSAAGKLCEDEGPGDGKKLVLLDARNLYETRIGKFETQSVETLDPGIRQYSDLPSWVDDNVDKLRGNRVLMYCTGGIRCEMASAYIRSKGAGFENVYQLYGGIQRYMEQFPDGGYFKGKNFVFDHRISVGSTSGSIIGKCLLCGLSFDDYSLRCRCAFCRMLVLVCNDCRKESTEYACEICQRHQNVAECGQSLSTKDSKTFTNDLGCDSDDRKAQLLSDQTVHVSCSPGLSPSRKLRILCLHGFRQNASGFKGRTASLAKKLKNIAELVFVNAPYELPFMYQPTRNDDNVPCLPEQDPPPMQRCNKKYAWLVAPGFHSRSQDDWDKTDAPFDPNQYQQQTEGFKESLSYLNSIFCQQGPFDGILGFSQGAAMTALVCAERARLEATMNFRFAILCSGFAVKLSSLEKGSINFPSLHVFGTHLGRDRQIASDSSRDLASVFEEGCRVIIEHDSGHIIPTQTPYIDQIRGFLGRFA